MEALTDVSSGKHYYSQTVLRGGNVPQITEDAVGANGSVLIRAEGGFHLVFKTKDFSLSAKMNAAKLPVWHCEDGFLKMGITDDDRQTTFYYSYTNLPLTGILRIGGKERCVTGRGWFDKQGGPFRMTKFKTHWEWFSLRFFDDEEIMLFSFPQDDYRDGTYIRMDGGYVRLNDYTIEAQAFTTSNGQKFSCKWKIKLPDIRDEEYAIEPLAEGQVNFAYFELLAGIYDRNGALAGYCFVELLPGVYNKKQKFTLLKKV
jgi:predicted secreted hydrolase